MNNKFIKRVAAVVLGVAVLSTCAFAASTTISGTDYASEKLYFTLSAPEADKVSYIAYASDADGAQGAIVAIGQFDGTEGGTEALPISADLLGDATHILLKSGNSTGDAASEVLIPTAEFFASVNLKNDGLSEVEIGGVKFINVPMYALNVEFNKKGSVEVTSLTAKVEGEGVNTIEAAKLNGLASTVYAAGSNLEVANFYLAGAPLEYLQAEGGIALEAECSFTAAE